VNDFPWLTALMVLPLVGSLVVAGLPRTRPLLAKQVTLAVSLVTLLLVVAVAVEGPPPALDPVALVGFGYLSLVATALASVCWFAGLSRLPAGTVGIVGLLNPVTGVLLGVLAGAELLSLPQAAGIALVLAGILLGRRTPAVR